MLTWRELLEAQALRDRGMTILAIARHLDRDPKTIRAYLSGERTPGVRRSSAPDPFAPYVTQRLNDDKHLWATTLYDEVVALGYTGSYPSFTRAIRTRELRPACEECAAASTRDRAIIAHPAGDETQLDWLELPDPPAAWGGARRCAPVGRVAGALEQVARSAGRVRGPAAPDRGPRPGGAPARRVHAGLAVRPDLRIEDFDDHDHDHDRVLDERAKRFPERHAALEAGLDRLTASQDKGAAVGR